jgi:hypothetical protein|tara:strand:- start:240 stop:494 length:255 start_codon:yes stop_codon:yes gene_type:complete
LPERKPSKIRLPEKRLNTRNSLNSKSRPLSKKDKPLSKLTLKSLSNRKLRLKELLRKKPLKHKNLLKRKLLKKSKSLNKRQLRH